MKHIFIFTCFCISAGKIYAQGMKNILNRAKSDVQYRVTQKTNEKIDRAVDQGIDKAFDKTLYKLFPKPAGSVFTNNPGAAANKVSVKKPESTNGKTNSNGEIMISTNIKCNAGKKSVEQDLMSTPGVSTAMIDTDTGMLYLTLTGTLTNYDGIVDMIRKNGFSADGKKSIGAANNCK